MDAYFTIFLKFRLIIWIKLGVLVILMAVLITKHLFSPDQVATKSLVQENYWLLLERKSNIEKLFYGSPGFKDKSRVVREFKVKSGIPAQRPTPLPQLLGRKYWVITKKFETKENPETAPYFVELDVPILDEEPFGPVPYKECSGPSSTQAGIASTQGEQCNWGIPGPFGLHGVNGDTSRLSADKPGSSGCIRHSDEDIAFLYNLIDVKKNIRYYVEDI